MKNVFDGLISILDMIEKIISELEHIQIKTSKTKRQRKQRPK